MHRKHRVVGVGVPDRQRRRKHLGANHHPVDRAPQAGSDPKNDVENPDIFVVDGGQPPNQSVRLVGKAGLLARQPGRKPTVRDEWVGIRPVTMAIDQHDHTADETDHHEADKRGTAQHE